MKTILQFGLLIIAILLALLVSILGATEIADWLNTSFGRTTFTAQDVYSRVVLFLLGTFFVEILIERITTFNTIDKIEKKIHEMDARIRPFFARFTDSKHRRFHELLWKYVLRGAGAQEDSETLVVNRANSISLWRDCISEADSWEALSYARDLWQNDEQEISKAHQDIHIKLGGQIYRIFVFDTDSDRQDFQNDPSKKDILSSGDIRWIIKDKLTDNLRERLQTNFRNLDLIDFAIADNSNYVLWFQLTDSTKKLERALLTINDKVISQARLIFDVAYANSQKFR
jgi:hypothetical protein